MNCSISWMIVAVLVISIVTPGLSKPKPEPSPVPRDYFGDPISFGIEIVKQASKCHDNCWLNDWRTRDSICGDGGKYSYEGPVHGRCYCCPQ